ncbi:GTP 3',8-cyclase MoaA [Azotobacter beijerinckii]|uniref:Cyclic pyranopterin phosphate synthase n=1 Tax=Azotobacter beijerinckii TaxID=170623 RepID=A0A1I4ED47_9GAMM|nr:radical SAM protein [Azotobacter beijerinckii]SFA97107.1 cyclic pyranopterin phosphate synthase [Azotobacter beijerinckii]SFL03119.1 cyclic pyranopterin phosphate synthase [Azotobacter beijerinckii]
MRSEPPLDDDEQGRIIDAQGRRLRNLRVSLTSACNYACVYCVADGKRLHADRKALSLSRLLLAVEYLKVANDLRTLRITGGEPLISPLFDGFMAELGRLGFADVSLTSNGQLLSRKLPVLLAAGVERINVSLDTLDAGALRRIARGGDLAEVLEGIERALAAGMRVKINMVPLRGHNHEQVLPMLEYCLARGMELRFIELMRMGHLARDPRTFQRQFFGMAEILATISERYAFASAPRALDATVQRFEIPGRGHFGVIANESAPFCSQCSRARLSSTGWLHGCLSSSRSHYLGDVLELPRDEALARIRELSARALADKQAERFSGDVMVMRVIGG